MTPNELQRLYSSHQWRLLRRRILERDGYRCYFTGCATRATTADHRVPALEAPGLFFDSTNLRASCTSHNYGRANARAAEIVRANERKQQSGTRRQW